VIRERDYYAQQSRGISGLLYLVSTVVGGIMAVGAIFTAVNILYSAVVVRKTEIATLRAIGFGASGVVTSVLVEALLLAVLGALLGAAVAWLGFSGNVLSTSSGAFDNQVAFSLVVSPGLVGLGIAWAIVIGLLGGLLPAIRAARMPVAIALRPV
jgi:putative ABC transport system permease protein